MKSFNAFFISAILLFGMAFSLASCGGEGKSEGDKMDHLLDLQDDVIQVHDDVMPLTSNINRARQKLMDSYQEHHEGMEENLENRMGVILQRLNDAHDGMFEWMGDWADSDQEAMEYDEAIQYYKSEMERIEKVSEDMKSSLRDAEDLLDELGIE